MREKMELRGKLRDDIISGHSILFLGAGIGMAAGLYCVKGLANYLFQEAQSPLWLDKYKDDLSKLVSKLDNDPQFTRKWVNEKLKDYFLKDSNYKNLENHKNLLEHKWEAIFTTNYDIAMEKASDKVTSKRWRLFPVSNPNNKGLIFEGSTDITKLVFPQMVDTEKKY